MKNCSNLEAFRENLLHLVNNCHLSVGEAYYVLRDVMNELRFVYTEELYKEQMAKEPEVEVEKEFISLEPEKEEEMNDGDENND
jgi:hypothetical protein